MNSKEKYRLLCEQERSIPLFSQPWWLNSVCGEKNWDVCLVEKSDQILAAMPYYIIQEKGFRMISMPPITQSLGPWISASEAKYAKKLGRENSLIEDLFDQLPPHDNIKINWHHKLSNWLSLYWRGYQQTTRYTYIINNLQNQNYLDNFSSSYRNKINKARKLVCVKENLDISQFYQINTKTFTRQSISTPYSLEFLKKHDAILNAHNARKIFYAEDPEGNIHSALYLTWDSYTAYVHLVGEDSDFRKSGAGILLIAEAIKYTKEILKLDSFDFEGSMLKNVELVRRGCGGIQTPYFAISKTNSKLIKCYQILKTILN